MLIFQAASLESRQRLAAAAQGSLVLVEVGQHRQAALAAELGAAHQDVAGRGLGHVQVPRVGVAQLVVLVQQREAPLVVGDVHPPELQLHVEGVPRRRLGQRLRARHVVEAVQLLHVDWLAQLLQRREDVVAVPLPGQHERDGAERLAAQLQRGAGRGQRQLLHAPDVHVQDPRLLLVLRVEEHEVRGGEEEVPQRRLPDVVPVQHAHVLHFWSCDVVHRIIHRFHGLKNNCDTDSKHKLTEESV